MMMRRGISQNRADAEHPGRGKILLREVESFFKAMSMVYDKKCQ